jgi:rubredoxin
MPVTAQLDEREHGYNLYTYGCRCPACRAAKADYMREKRSAAKKAARPGLVVMGIKHGTRSAFTDRGCRCPECTEAMRAYKREQNSKRRIHDQSDRMTLARLCLLALGILGEPATARQVRSRMEWEGDKYSVDQVRNALLTLEGRQRPAVFRVAGKGTSNDPAVWWLTGYGLAVLDKE